MRLLVAEDNQFDAGLLGQLLQFAGHTADVVGNGAVALERLRAGERYDAILLDMVMPQVTGLEFLVEARKDSLLHCPVVCITGYDPAWAQDIAGIDYLLTKPFEEAALWAVLDEIETSRPLP